MKQVFLERERHANVRQGDLSYPMRGVRDYDFLYIRNLMNDRWPAGDPDVHQSVGQWGDVDNSISKFLVMGMENKPATNTPDYFQLTFAKRPAKELYAVKEDPFQLNNLAEDPAYSETLSELHNKLQQWMDASGDLRATNPQNIYWDTVLYTPNYQFENFDLVAKINQYRLRPPRGPGSAEGIPCLD